jgi:hypothetical protein
MEVTKDAYYSCGWDSAVLEGKSNTWLYYNAVSPVYGVPSSIGAQF